MYVDSNMLNNKALESGPILKHLFIINPSAGKGRPLKFIPEIKRFFNLKTDEYFIEITNYPGHATEIVRQYVTQDKFRVYSVGGDGTLNEIINGMMGSGSSLAIIPTGSGNDFIKSLDYDLLEEKLLFQTVYGREVPIDLAVVNRRYFANIASFGFDAEVVDHTQKIKRNFLIPSGLCYYAGIIATLFQYRNLHLKVSIDGRKMDTKFLLIAVANGKYYGGGILPAPEAKIDDGLFDICLITGKNFFEIIWTLPKYVKGQHRGVPGVHFYKAREVKIICDQEVALNIDGEVVKVNEAVFRIIPHGINLVIPCSESLLSQEQVAVSGEKITEIR
jgi:YegS/Rv2252/BmrU family lipid kinase